MKINVPDEEEFRKAQRKRKIQAVFGLFFGFFFFGLVGTKIFRYGLDEVETYTWIALGTGILSFGFLAFKFGNQFWATLFRH